MQLRVTTHIIILTSFTYYTFICELRSVGTPFIDTIILYSKTYINTIIHRHEYLSIAYTV